MSNLGALLISVAIFVLIVGGGALFLFVGDRISEAEEKGYKRRTEEVGKIKQTEYERGYQDAEWELRSRFADVESREWLQKNRDTSTDTDADTDISDQELIRLFRGRA